MKTVNFVPVLLVTFSLAACAPATQVIPSETVTPSQAFTPIPPTPTPTWWMTPEITATPLDLVLDTNTNIRDVIMQLHPDMMAGMNIAILTPPPRDVPPSPLEIIEVNDPPDPNSYYFEEIADNIDNSRRAFVACKPDKCVDNLYIRDNQTGRVYVIDFGAMTWRPIIWLSWINKDTLIFGQSSSPHYARILAIDFPRKVYQYYGMACDQYQCPQSTPTP